MDELLLGGHDGSDPTLINKAKSAEFVLNPAGQRIHLRSEWPSDQSGCAAAFVLSLHGYGAHGNRPTHSYLASSMNTPGITYITLDFTGHGYSEGERGLVGSPGVLVDDALSVLVALFNTEAAPVNQAHRVRRTVPVGGMPFFVQGHSMGGGTALLVANILTHGDVAAAIVHSSVFHKHRDLFERSIMPSFRGAILVAPVVLLEVPMWARFVLPLISSLFPTASIPKCLIDENDYNAGIWSSPRYVRFIESDGYPRNPRGLSYGANIRFRTMATLMDLSRAVQHTLPQATFHFLVIHDDAGDVVVSGAGTQMLMERSPSVNKTRVCVGGGLHDPLANKIDVVAHTIAAWLAKQLTTGVAYIGGAPPSCVKMEEGN